MNVDCFLVANGSVTTPVANVAIFQVTDERATEEAAFIAKKMFGETYYSFDLYNVRDAGPNTGHKIIASFKIERPAPIVTTTKF